MLPMTFHVYIVRCADASLYTGVAIDVARRVDEHNGITAAGTPSKRGARYTAPRRPVVLVYRADHASRALAQKEEARLKRLPRTAKLALIAKATGALATRDRDHDHETSPGPGTTGPGCAA